MHTLFVDLASHHGILACVTENETVCMQEVDHRIRDHELIPLVESSLKKAGWTYKDLTHITCVVGPGGFTSLRVAVTLVNVLSHELDIPVAGIHLSDVYRVRVGDGVRETDCVWLHSTKKDQLFACGHSWKEPTLISVADLQTLTLTLQWMGELIPEHRLFMDGTGIRECKLHELQEVLPILLSKQTYKKEPLVPWYGREW